jgi:hypothetical protein
MLIYGNNNNRRGSFVRMSLSQQKCISHFYALSNVLSCLYITVCSWRGLYNIPFKIYFSNCLASKSKYPEYSITKSSPEGNSPLIPFIPSAIIW